MMDPVTRSNTATRRVRCEVCNQEVASGSLPFHLQFEHNVRHCYLGEAVITEEPQTFEAQFMPATGKWLCPRRGRGASRRPTSGPTLPTATRGTRCGSGSSAPTSATAAGCRPEASTLCDTSRRSSARSLRLSDSDRGWRRR